MFSLQCGNWATDLGTESGRKRSTYAQICGAVRNLSCQIVTSPSSSPRSGFSTNRAVSLSNRQARSLKPPNRKAPIEARGQSHLNCCQLAIPHRLRTAFNVDYAVQLSSAIFRNALLRQPA